MNLIASLARLVVSRLRWVFASGDERDAEILALRHQIRVLQRQVVRPTLTETDRTVLAVLSTVFGRHWTTQAARNFLMGVGDEFRFVIRDGAGQYPSAFDAVFEATGATAITTPAWAPMANAYAERWVGTLRHEVLDRTIIWNERQLRALLNEYLHHYNQHRPHSAIHQRAPNDADVVAIVPGRTIERHTTCGGLINEYRHAA